MDLELGGRVAVVTGASKGIGLAVTRALAGEGARVVAGARSVGTLEGLAGVTPVALDLSSAIAVLGGFATGRFTTPEEVATLIVLLASERTGNVTGTNAVIDGGLIKTT